jgi:hypothetical protein
VAGNAPAIVVPPDSLVILIRGMDPTWKADTGLRAGITFRITVASYSRGRRTDVPVGQVALRSEDPSRLRVLRGAQIEAIAPGPARLTVRALGVTRTREFVLRERAAVAVNGGQAGQGTDSGRSRPIAVGAFAEATARELIRQEFMPAVERKDQQRLEAFFAELGPEQAQAWARHIRGLRGLRVEGPTWNTSGEPNSEPTLSFSLNITWDKSVFSRRKSSAIPLHATFRRDSAGWHIRSVLPTEPIPSK